MGTTGRPGGVIAGTVTTGTAGSDSGRGREAWGVTAGTTRGEQSGQGRACCVAGAHTDCHRVKAAVPTAPTNVCAERGIVRAEVMGASSMECMESAQARPAAALVQQCGCTQSQQGGVHTVTTGGSAHSHKSLSMYKIRTSSSDGVSRSTAPFPLEEEHMQNTALASHGTVST